MNQGLNKTEKECVVIFGEISEPATPDNPASYVDIPAGRFLTDEEIDEILNTQNRKKTEKS